MASALVQNLADGSRQAGAPWDGDFDHSRIYKNLQQFTKTIGYRPEKSDSWKNLSKKLSYDIRRLDSEIFVEIVRADFEWLLKNDSS